jgi:hypothetical protein
MRISLSTLRKIIRESVLHENVESVNVADIQDALSYTGPNVMAFEFNGDIYVAGVNMQNDQTDVELQKLGRYLSYPGRGVSPQDLRDALESAHRDFETQDAINKAFAAGVYLVDYADDGNTGMGRTNP